MGIGVVLQRYLMASYAYYVLDNPIMSDGEYDKLSKQLVENWDTLEHQHKYLLSKDDLVCGTGYAIKDYPKRIISAVEYFLREKALRTYDGTLK